MLAEIKGLNEECGVFAIWGHEKAAEVTYYGLHALQHRGQEGAGIVTTDRENLHLHKGIGLINEVFSEGQFNKLNGNAAIGHVRYATAGAAAMRTYSHCCSVPKRTAWPSPITEISSMHTD